MDRRKTDLKIFWAYALLCCFILSGCSGDGDDGGVPASGFLSIDLIGIWQITWADDGSTMEITFDWEGNIIPADDSDIKAGVAQVSDDGTVIIDITYQSGLPAIMQGVMSALKDEMSGTLTLANGSQSQWQAIKVGIAYANMLGKWLVTHSGGVSEESDLFVLDDNGGGFIENPAGEQPIHLTYSLSGNDITISWNNTPEDSGCEVIMSGSVSGLNISGSWGGGCPDSSGQWEAYMVSDQYDLSGYVLGTWYVTHTEGNVETPVYFDLQQNGVGYLLEIDGERDEEIDYSVSGETITITWQDIYISGAICDTTLQGTIGTDEISGVWVTECGFDVVGSGTWYATRLIE